MPESTSSSRVDPPLWAVILAGGVGSRFWPVSTPARPKQLLPLASTDPLIADTVARIEPLVPRSRIRIITGAALAPVILEALPGLDRGNLMIEPAARGTAPALAWAAQAIAREEPDAVMVSLHADHVIGPAAEFRDLVAETAGLAAELDRLFTIGVRPTRPETGFGYIRVGERISRAPEAFEVADFVEKPDRDTAREYLTREGYLWNSGIFIWRVRTLLAQIEQYTPELAPLLPLLEAEGPGPFFERAPVLSIDEGLLETSPNVAVVPAGFDWDDIGSWDAVGRRRPTDEQGNVSVGDVHAVEAENCIAWAEEGSIVLFGTKDLVVVRAAGLTFVTPRERAAELKDLLKRLPDRLRKLEPLDG
ncbi:MAG TPA: sugar phosphate nucleotidyltransferase [Longimicrobiales bacterium]